ncbi:hypothetical protein ODZ84_03055 [Chryseobacterium fluminis]|uniref:hypothetical protein n=1 Tax=Chryseobacterium fluminis TaxID=2983606 RepID=UPI00224C82CF|nr:hypothetical protein [Chryseobacterium sp. MMS21-Ot14]UZT98565.1 hypothetical protein ODZ84_03055 [Chryseobacterium sp. MMS21-Ot14]
MNLWDHLIVVLLIAVFNVAVYIIFRKYLYQKPDAGMKFIAVNIVKDIIWLIVSLAVIDKTRDNFLFIVICFIIASFLIYMPIIKLINKSH